MRDWTNGLFFPKIFSQRFYPKISNNFFCSRWKRIPKDFSFENIAKFLPINWSFPKQKILLFWLTNFTTKNRENPKWIFFSKDWKWFILLFSPTSEIRSWEKKLSEKFFSTLFLQSYWGIFFDFQIFKNSAKKNLWQSLTDLCLLKKMRIQIIF